MLNIKKKEHKKLVSREELDIESDDPITPSMESVKEYLSSELKKEKDLIVVKKVNPSYGKQHADILVYIYESKEALDKFEPKKKDKKKAEAK